MPTTAQSKRPPGRVEPQNPATVRAHELIDLLLQQPTPDDLRALQADLSAQADRDLSAREMGEMLGYEGRGVADRRWREYLAGRPLDSHRWTLLMLAIGRHPTLTLQPRQGAAAPNPSTAP